MRRVVFVLLILLAACAEAPAAATLTPTHQMSGPTIAPSPQPFSGPPTEGPPQESGFVGANDPTAAAQPNQGALPPVVLSTPAGDHQMVEIAAADSTLLMGALYQNPGSPLQPGILLLGEDEDRIAQQLQTAGFTVLLMQPRDESDVAVILDALGSGFADPARIAVIGPAADSVVALRGCALAPGCDAAILIDPLAADTDLLNALALYGAKPLLLLASEDDATVRLLSENAAGEFSLQHYGADTVALLVDWLNGLWF